MAKRSRRPRCKCGWFCKCAVRVNPTRAGADPAALLLGAAVAAAAVGVAVWVAQPAPAAR